MVASQQQLSCNPLKNEKVSIIPGVMLEVDFWLLFMKKETYMCSISNTEKKWKPIPESQNTRNKNNPSDYLFQSPDLISEEQSYRDIRGQTKTQNEKKEGITE